MPDALLPDERTTRAAIAAALDALTPPVRAWVQATFPALTPPQVAAIPAIHAGRNVLVAAPTGTGKTLAAFLAVLSELVALHESGALAAGIHVVYVSPLRALGYDVQRNLERPLAEITARHLTTAQASTPDDTATEPPIRVASRTGDTTPAERRRMQQRPPHILVTTPESLAILLATPGFRAAFATVRWVVVDEVHALAGDKRGVHLTLTLERLAAAARGPITRIGLSATVAPLEGVARWLAGSRRPCEVIEWRTDRAAAFIVRSVLSGEVIPNPPTVQRLVGATVAERVEANRTTLVFTNTRAATERLAHRLMQRFGEDAVAAHHSSLAREERLRVEERLRAGDLRCVVTSTSLELGIDIGTVDETVLVGSPRDATRALQRVGRSGHRIDRHPRGLFIATGVEDLFETIVVAEHAASGTLDPARIPVAPLDVLAQQLVAMSAERDWRDDEAFTLVRRAAPYSRLTRSDFDAVLDYLSEADVTLEEQRVYAKIERERGVFRARSQTVRTIFYQNVGTITGGASVRIKPLGATEPVGSVEEDFIERLVAGDRFLLAGRVWAFRYAQGMTAFVSPAGGRPSVPRWASELMPASPGIASGVGALRAWCRDRLHEGGEAHLAGALTARAGIEPEDAAAVASYIAAQDALSPIPDAASVLIERWVDPDDDRVLVHLVTAPIGRRATEALARVVAWRGGTASAGLLVDDQAFAVRLPRRAAWTADDLPRLFTAAGLADDARAAIAKSDLWARRFRQVATIGLMLVKHYRGSSKFTGGMQHNARRIARVLERERPEFPLVRETYRTVLEDDLDVPGAAAWLKRARGRVTLRELRTPPPFAFRLLAGGTTDAMLLEERDAFLRRLWDEAAGAVSEPAAAPSE